MKIKKTFYRELNCVLDYVTVYKIKEKLKILFKIL
jgi:hypothetical protein